MGVDVNTLKVVADTEEVKDGERDLDNFAKTGARAEQSTKRFGLSTQKSAMQVATLVKGVAGLAAAVGAISLGKQFAAQGREVSKALAEVSTLIDGTDAQLGDLMSASEQFTTQFGGSVEKQLAGFYQTISAGASSVAEATQTMDAANKLALGGVTDITTAVDGLTTILNAYGDKAGTATDVSDAMFVAMKAGKTTIGELSSSIGGVAPLAESAGVSIEELLAATAALTKGGISTSESMTGLRAMLAAVTKPSSEASKLAKKLGIDFSTSAIQAKGFTGFLDDLVAKTGGSSDALATLFGGVEAIVPALALSGKAGDSFNEVMAQMQEKAGATDEAVQKVAGSLDGRLSAALGRFNVYGEQAGQAILGVIVPALEKFNQLIDFATQHSSEIGAVMVGLAATQIPLLTTGIIGLVSSIMSITAATGALGVALSIAGGPLGILLGLVAGGAAYFLTMRDNTNEAGTAFYDAQKGSIALNQALGVFYQTAAPSAGKSAIALANDNYKLADSAYSAAQAQLANAQASVDAAAALASSPLGGDERSQAQAKLAQDVATKRAEAATERLRKAKMALDQARNDRDRAARTVSGADYSGVSNPEIPTVNIPDITSPSGSSSKKAADISKITDAYEKLKASLDPAYEAQKKFEDGQKTLKAALDAGDITLAEYREGMAQLRLRYDDATSAGLNWTNTLEQAGQSLSQSLSQARSFDDVLGALGSTLDNLASQLMQAALNMAIFGNAAGKIGGGGGGGLIGSIVGALGGSLGGTPTMPAGGYTLANVAGARASGGPVMAGRTYLVGEKGPELWTAPSAGTIIPNDKLGGGGVT
ncbi:phage tail tape measure protein, partial [Thioclava sp.]|uniref:phage tail tape measure protein n=1 Tax=Thioclava sp. TaxID=1933450 RepID=UPI003242499D